MPHFIKPSTLLSSKRLLSTVSDSSKDLVEKSILLGKNSYSSTKHKDEDSQNLKDTKQDSNHLKLLDDSIKKAEFYSKNYLNPKKYKQLPLNYAQNQHIQVNNSNELNSILWKFDAPIRYAFAYGSGVFNQGYQDPETQIDLIFGVTYPEHWHSINMRYNPDHYSSLKYFGSGTISKFQEIGAGVYFNPFVEIDGKLIKYGVVSIDRLVKDLSKWDNFYLAGRLQKPVKILRDDTMVKYWNQQNLKYAASLAYHQLQTPKLDDFNEFEFFKKITQLSYVGDIRYKLGAENPYKIDNIVEKNFEFFQSYYSPILNEILVKKNFSLPPGFTMENSEQKLQKIILENSTKQTIKGIFTAGLSKSIKYAIAKRTKAKVN